MDLAHDVDVELGRAGVLRRVAADLLPIAQRHGCDAVVGASLVGERLAAAVAASDGEQLGIFTGGEHRVLVLDGILTTGTQMRRAIDQARKAGATHVFGAALVADHDAVAACRRDAGAQIISLQEF